MAKSHYTTDNSQLLEEDQFWFGYVLWNGIPYAKRWSGLAPEKDALCVERLGASEFRVPLDILKLRYPYIEPKTL
jgi:hypothetical protein